MNKGTPHIIVHKKRYRFEKLEEVAKSKLADNNISEWEFEFYNFITEWFNTENYIEVNTSGSTGTPKIIRLPKIALVKSAQRTIQYFNLEIRDNLLLNLSCKYIAGKVMVIRALIGKMNLWVLDPSTDFSILESKQFDLGAMVPNQLSNLLANPNGEKRIANIKNLLIGGASVPFKLEQSISNFPTNIVSTYGMTETATHIAIRHLTGDKRSDFYQTMQGVRIRKNKENCLEIITDGIDEWLSTNDMVELKSPTEFKILGRADNVINSGGLKFNPETIERKLEALIDYPFYISSKKDEKLGQKLILVIEATESEELKGKLDNIFKLKLNQYEKPREVLFTPLISRTENGKIKRN